MLATTGAQVRLLVAQAIRQAKRELVVVSPYLIPGPAGVAGLAALRQRGVQVTVLTNSLAATDEPMVHVGYRKYRVALLREGVALYEWSPARGDRVWRELLVGDAVLRLWEEVGPAAPAMQQGERMAPLQRLRGDVAAQEPCAAQDEQFHAAHCSAAMRGWRVRQRAGAPARPRRPGRRPSAPRMRARAPRSRRSGSRRCRRSRCGC